MIKTKRVYEAPDKIDGTRFLVERLYPRGIKKENLQMQDWLKDIAPSSQLRRWFNHDPEKWSDFKKKYWAELENEKDKLEPIRQASHKHNVTLLYSAHDTEHNNAVALKEYLEKSSN